MLQLVHSTRTPVRPPPFRQAQGVRIYQGQRRRTMVGSMAAICRMLERDSGQH